MERGCACAFACACACACYQIRMRSGAEQPLEAMYPADSASVLALACDCLR